MGKIKIIRSPAFVFENPPYTPSLGLSTIYSYLKERGFDIVQEDLNIINHPPEKTLLKLRDKERFADIFSDIKRVVGYLAGGGDAELDGITAGYLKGVKFDGIDVLLISIFQFDLSSSIMALLIAKYFKTGFNDKPVIIGGENIHAAHIYEDFEKYNKLGVVDYYIAGFGERPLYEILGKIEKRDASFRDIPGLCYREGGGIRRNRPDDQILTVPDFDGLPMELYAWRPGKFFRKIRGKPSNNADILILPFQMICGCPNHCAFCITSLGTKLYYMKPGEAVRGLKRLSEKHNTGYFFFMDNTFNISKDFVDNFCDEVIKSGLEVRWSDCASPNNIDDPAMLVKMRRAGACRLIFGLETASAGLLSRVDKRTTPEQAARVLRWSHEAGIWTGLEIIAGLPHEKEDDLRKTADFLTENMEYIDEIHLNKFFLVNPSAMFKYPERYGITNIRECKTDLRESIMGNRERSRYIFDEIDGLKWEDKNKQAEHSYDTLDRLRRSKQREPLGTPACLNILFYLYARLSDKNDIRHYYNKYRRMLRFGRFLPTGALFWKIRSKMRKAVKERFCPVSSKKQTL